MAGNNQLFAVSPTGSHSPPQDQAGHAEEFNLLSGSSHAILQLRDQIRRVAPYFRTALFTGECDCGEEQAARALLQLSPLGDKPFLELTAANAEARFGPNGPPSSEASEGMIYLCHPERIPQTVQSKLLRLMRERGSSAPRVVTFADRGLRSLVSVGTFSAELAESLGALRITLPPLRERQDDIPALLTGMVREQAELLGVPVPQLEADLLELASGQAWPGNFAQLRDVALNLVKHAGHEPLRAADFEAILGKLPTPPRRDRREVRMVSLDRILHEHIRAVLCACNGNKLRAAEVLCISRSTLYRMLETELPAVAAAPPRADAGGSTAARDALPLAS